MNAEGSGESILIVASASVSFGGVVFVIELLFVFVDPRVVILNLSISAAMSVMLASAAPSSSGFASPALVVWSAFRSRRFLLF